MLNQDLINVLNSGDAWAFVGNGCSADAGIPSWEGLLEKTRERAETQIGALPSISVKNYEVKKSRGQLTDAFSILKEYFTSDAIDSLVSDIINKIIHPGNVAKIIASWPFQSYVTTNYDHLLEAVLKNYGGWVPIGNTASENRKISGDVDKIVWHPHGGAKLGTKNSRLVLAKSDYDEIYPAGSPTLNTLEAIIRLKRIVFIGFGFRDQDLIITLDKVGRFILPERPAYAFMSNTTVEYREELWEKYRVDVIPYIANGDNHSDILKVLKAYSSFVVDRSIKFGRIKTTPDYDIETVGLLTKNRILRSDLVPKEDAQSTLIKAFVLARLKISGRMEENAVLEEIVRFASVDAEVIKKVVSSLIQCDILAREECYIYLTVSGDIIADEGKGEYELKRDKFKNSVLTRALKFIPEEISAQNVCDVTVQYLESTCRERGLGVAQQLVESGIQQIKARTVALLQNAKSELSFAKDRDSALATIQCISGILTLPTQEERKFLGYLTQAYFAKHLLGIEPSTIGIEKETIKSTVFIADSNFIIPLLAEGSVGHLYAKSLYDKLIKSGSCVVTSDLLLTECIEHAKWSWDFLNKNGSSSYEIIDALRGARGFKQNAFLTGYINNEEFGPDVYFKKYFAKIFGNYGEAPKEKDFIDILDKIGIKNKPLNSWLGFLDEMYHEEEIVQKEIRNRRERNNTYKHDRQVKAEAEVAIIVSKVRSRVLSIEGIDLNEAYFLSYSRVVDGISGQAQKICIFPESLFEWILSINEISEDDANAIYDQMLWELSKNGLELVPRQQLLRMFNNTVDASRHKLNDVIEEHKDIIRDLYSADPEKAFSDIDPLFVPSVADAVSKEVLRIMKERLIDEQNRRNSAEKVAIIAMKDQKEFKRLKAQKKQRKAEAIRMKRSAASRSSKKKKKK
jgi:SIR2-like domain